MTLACLDYRKHCGCVRADRFCQNVDQRWSPPFKMLHYGMKIVRLATTCQLHDLYNNHVIKGHDLSTAVGWTFQPFAPHQLQLEVGTKALFETTFCFFGSKRHYMLING